MAVIHQWGPMGQVALLGNVPIDSLWCQRTDSRRPWQWVCVCVCNLIMLSLLSVSLCFCNLKKNPHANRQNTSKVRKHLHHLDNTLTIVCCQFDNTHNTTKYKSAENWKMHYNKHRWQRIWMFYGDTKKLHNNCAHFLFWTCAHESIIY